MRDLTSRVSFILLFHIPIAAPNVFVHCKLLQDLKWQHSQLIKEDEICFMKAILTKDIKLSIWVRQGNEGSEAESPMLFKDRRMVWRTAIDTSDYYSTPFSKKYNCNLHIIIFYHVVACLKIVVTKIVLLVFRTMGILLHKVQCLLYIHY